MKSKIGVGVVGAGFIGPAHIEALRRLPNVEVVGLVASRDRTKSKAKADKLGVPKSYDSWEKLVGDSAIDVVHNCTPNYLHFTVNKAVLDAKKPIFSEKPLAMTSEEGDELVKLAAKAKLPNGVCFNYRGYPLNQHARALIRSGEIGKVFHVHGGYIQDWLLYPADYNWRIDPKESGASRAFADIGSHWCDLVQYVTGLRIRKVMGLLKTVHPTRKKMSDVEAFAGGPVDMSKAKDIKITTEDYGMAMVQFDNGALGQLTVTQINAGRKNQLKYEIACERAAIAFDQEDPDRMWIGRKDAPNTQLLRDGSLVHKQAQSYIHYPGGHPEGYADGLKNLLIKFYAHVSGETKEVDYPTFKDGAWENRICDAVLKSSREGGTWQEVSEKGL